MKLFCAFVALACTVLASVNPQLRQVKRVYILSMGSGMDQYLANQLTKSGIFEVVTDPKKADAIVTDNVGESFQQKLNSLYPPPPKPEAPNPAGDDDNATAQKPGNKGAFDGLDLSGGHFGGTSFSRGKGNFFVVDRNSRIVLWSVYEPSKNSTPGELTKTASRVVKHLKDDLTEKKAAE